MYKSIEKWMPGYLSSLRQRPRDIPAPIHVMFCIADHFEPLGIGGMENLQAGTERIARWVDELPGVVKDFEDFDGVNPKHTFFFPTEEYHPDLMGPLAELCRHGYGEVEIHLHHDNDTAANLHQSLSRFRDLLHGTHGLLGCDHHDRPRYAFIHGNWALCNSHPDKRYCGINGELRVLRETGSYADMTMPSGPSPTQCKLINSIYYAFDNPDQPRSHDVGVRVCVNGDGLQEDNERFMLIQGPLGLNSRWRKWGVIPRLDFAGIHRNAPPLPARVDCWVRQHIHVKHKPEWIFIKVHTHGCAPRNMDTLLGEPMREMYRHLLQRYSNRDDYCLHFVSAREMYNIIKAAEAGETGNPGDFRDYAVKPPPIMSESDGR